MALVVTLLRSTRLSVFVAEVSRGRTALVSCQNEADFEARMGDIRPDLMLVEFPETGCEETLRVLRTCRNSHGSTPIIVYLPFQFDAIVNALNATRQGIASTVLMTQTDEAFEQTRQALLNCTENDVVNRIIEAGEAFVPQPLQSLVSISVRKASKPVRVTDLAKHCGVDRKTLSNAFRRHRMPHVRDLIMWHRTLRTAYVIGRSSNSLAQIANELRYPSASDLSHVFSRYVGAPPSAFRSPDGFENAIAQYQVFLKDALQK